MKRVPYETMVNEFKRVLVKKGFTEDRAEAAAVIFAQNSLALHIPEQPVPTYRFQKTILTVPLYEHAHCYP